jgi:hypothetical protein
MRKGYVRIVWVEANDTQVTSQISVHKGLIKYCALRVYSIAFTELSSWHTHRTLQDDNSDDAAITVLSTCYLMEQEEL